MGFLNILAVVLSFVIGAWSQLPPHPVVFLPILYVTPMPERQGPDKAVVYKATICSPQLYAPYIAIARLNIPQGWHYFIGVYGKLEICTSPACTKVLCSNWDKAGSFDGNHNCSFPYNASIGDLYIRATTGPAPNIDWTVALEFLPREYFRNYYREPTRRYIDIPEPKAKHKSSSVTVLQQIVPTGVRESVTTLNTLQFNLSFCPDSGTTERYNIDILVTALDSRSAFATYACLPPITGPCTPDKSKHYDPRGIGVNVITLQTGSGTLKDVLVTVVGWGDGEQENNFLIGATLKPY